MLVRMQNMVSSRLVVLAAGLTAGACGGSNDGSDTSQGVTSDATTGVPPTTTTTTMPVDTGAVPTTGGSGDATGTGTSTGGEETSTGGDETSSDGTSTGGGFCAGAPDSDISVPPVALPQCAGVQAESTWCLTIGYDNTVKALGLDSSTACTVVPVNLGEITAQALESVGVAGDYLYLCLDNAPDGKVARVSLLDGSVEKSNVDCFQVSTWRGHPVVGDFSSSNVWVDEDWVAVMQGGPGWQVPLTPFHFTRFTGFGDALYGTWIDDEDYNHYQMPCGEELGEVARPASSPLVSSSVWATRMASRGPDRTAGARMPTDTAPPRTSRRGPRVRLSSSCSR